MTLTFVSAFAFKAIKTALLVALPLLTAGLVTGILVSIFQAVTSIQDMSLTFIPKILVVMVTLLLILPWIMGVLIAFTAELFTNFPAYIR
ncbi:MAG: flagellar biosynthetic protein FliQ [Candidatus Coatesbacteria bacterium]|nr:flagellar biosynthetic protein FliQ [Candidatus Coatesbacteria bacterium]